MFRKKINRLILEMVVVISAATTVTGATIRVPQDYILIQQAVDQADTGDTVLVSDGIYSETVTIYGKDIFLLSNSGPNSTSINGNGDGPVLFLNGTSAVVSGFSIVDGSSDGDVGGVRIQGDGCAPEIADCIINNNSGSSTGGIEIHQGSLAYIHDCIIENNTASGDGGGVRIMGADVLLERNIIAWNSVSGGSGGAVAILQECSPILINNTIYGNHCSSGRGAVNCNAAIPVISNTIIAGNTGGGGGIRCENYSFPVLSYNDVWNNEDCNYYNCEQGTGSLSEDPLFLESGGEPVDFSLQPSSPCIDQGDPTMVPPPMGGYRIDIGAVELTGAEGILIRVPADYSTIQAAIDASEDGDTVLVAPGTYKESLDLKGNSIALLSEEGPSSTIVHAMDQGPVLRIIRGENRYTLVRGFTFRNGYSSNGCGGIDIYASSPVIRGNEIWFCNSIQGGGIKVSGECSPLIMDNLFSHNSSTSDGGGALVDGASPVFLRNRFYLNISDGAGGGMMLRSGAGGSIINNSFSSNESTPGRGCVTVNSSFPVIRNNIIVFSTGGGGGIRCENGGNPVISYNCVWGNEGNDYVNCEPGPGDISFNPFFKGGDPYDFHLQSERGRWNNGEWVKDVRTSPAIDAGDPDDDIGEETAPNGGRLNLGAYGGTSDASLTKGERLIIPIDYPTIQSAVDAANNGDTILVDGDYSPYIESIVIDGISITVRARDMEKMPTIDAGGIDRVFTIADVMDTVRLEGLVITGGYSSGGGGIRIDHSVVEIDSCTIEYNNAVDGGGIYLENNTLAGFYHTHILNNAASDQGGGIFCRHSDFLMEFSVAAFDSAHVEGGAVYLTESSPRIVSSTLDNNKCSELTNGGAISCFSGSCPVINSTILTNTTFGYGVYADETSDPITKYSNFFMNYPSGDFGGPGDPDFTWECIRVDPEYTKEDPYYYLRSSSECIDKGDYDLDVPDGGGSRIDIGAYEYIYAFGHILNVPADYPTIQDAVDAAAEDDTVLVAPGIYHERIVWEGTPLYLVGAEGAEETVIDGDGSGSVISVSSVLDTTIGIKGFTIRGGSAETGGGIFLGWSSIRVHECVIENNSADSGGGLYLVDGSASIIFDNLIENNEAVQSNGGGMAVYNSLPVIYNNRFVNDTAHMDGGGIYLENCSPRIRNNLFWECSASFEGGGILAFGSCSPSIKYNIFGKINNGNAIFGESGCDPQIEYNDFWDNYPENIGGSAQMNSGNIMEDPLFVSETEPFDFHLQSVTGSYKDSLEGFTPDSLDSPCIDAGDPQYPVMDEPEPNGNIINIGPYGGTAEASLSEKVILLVPEEYPFIQSAIDVAEESNIILVSPGIYIENIVFGGEDVDLKSVAGPDSTIIYGSMAASVVTFSNHESRDCILDGFKITGGLFDEGGGIFCHANPIIRNCIITGNESDLFGGGGIFVQEGNSPALQNCEIRDNHALTFGGGIYSYDAYPEISDCDIHDNTSDISGGGIAVYNFEKPTMIPLLENNSIHNNEAYGNGGGGLFLETTNAIITGNDIRSNMAPYHGAGVYITGNPGAPEFTRNKVVDNVLTDTIGGRGGGIAIRYTGEEGVLVEGNDIIGNDAPEGSGVFCQQTVVNLADNIIMQNLRGPALQVISSTLLHGFNDYFGNETDNYEGCEPGYSDFYENPLFSDSLFSLSQMSPCIDAGYRSLHDETDGSFRDVGAVPYTHTLLLSLEADNYEVSPGETVLIDVAVDNPDYQKQEVTLILSVDFGHRGRVVIDSLDIVALPTSTTYETMEELIPSNARPGTYFVRGELIKDGVYEYGTDGFYLEIKQD